MVIVHNCVNCEYEQICKFKDKYQEELKVAQDDLNIGEVMDITIKCKYYKPKSNQVTFRNGKPIKPEPSKPLSGYDMPDPLKGHK